MAPSLRRNETRSWTDSTAGREKMTHALNSPARSLQWENKGKRGRQLHTNSNTDFLLSTSGYSVAPETLTVAQLSSSCLVVNGSSSSVSEDNLRGRKQSKADIGLSTSYFRVTRLFLFFLTCVRLFPGPAANMSAGCQPRFAMAFWCCVIQFQHRSFLLDFEG